MTDFGRRPVPVDHASRHEDGGIDELDAALLDGRINYVDRGEISAADFTTGDFTSDNTWKVLDLSGILPSNTKFFHGLMSIRDDAVQQAILMTKNGATNKFNRLEFRTQVADVWVDSDFICPVDTDRKVTYLLYNVVYSGVQLTIRGWFI